MDIVIRRNEKEREIGKTVVRIQQIFTLQYNVITLAILACSVHENKTS
jgi:hypothetical protein